VQFETASSIGPETGKTLLTVALSAPSGFTVTVAYAVTGGDATAGSDFTLMSGTLTFSPGQTTKTIQATIRTDRLAEPDEEFVVGLTAPSHALLGANVLHSHTILDDDGHPESD
jgi:chitinase